MKQPELLNTRFLQNFTQSFTLVQPTSLPTLVIQLGLLRSFKNFSNLQFSQKQLRTYMYFIGLYSCVCVCVHIHVYIYVYLYLNVYIYKYIYMLLCTIGIHRFGDNSCLAPWVPRGSVCHTWSLCQGGPLVNQTVSAVRKLPAQWGNICVSLTMTQVKKRQRPSERACAPSRNGPEHSWRSRHLTWAFRFFRAQLNVFLSAEV